MRKTWKRKLIKRRVAICGGREALADFVQGVKLTPPPPPPVGIGLKMQKGWNFFFFLTFLVPNNERSKPKFSSINYDLSAQPRWRPSRPIRGRMGPRTGPGLGLVPSGGPSPTCPSKRSSSSWSGPSSSSGSSASWRGPGMPDTDEVGVSKSPSGVETIIIKSTSSSLS